ncbi:MAG TPA: 3-dehydroquinate synthase [Syntrophomonadaceae bacterium]|nr:3-dehydroquinate synthase [Syntrophomonadaceae bacterium]
MQTLKLDLGLESYNILIGDRLLEKTGFYVRELIANRKVILVSNPTVFPLYGKRVVESLVDAGFEVFIHLVPDGEEYKNIDQAMQIINKCIEHKLERNGAIIALGGGVIGDLAGFVAAIYQRGIPFIQIPTTLLAQVDSSVGGKVAVNHPQAKNMIGAFHQPKLVIIDINTLKTLEERDYHSGLGEIVKYGIIYSSDFFQKLKDKASFIREKSPDVLAKIIYESCKIKGEIVEQDEKETSLRAILNLGHTFGHAIESLSGYGTYRHGEAVIMGSIAAAYLAVDLDLLAKNKLDKIFNLYKELDIFKAFPHLPAEDIYENMLTDKKVVNEQITFILPKNIGEYVIVKNAKKEQILKAIYLAQEYEF